MLINIPHKTVLILLLFTLSSWSVMAQQSSQEVTLSGARFTNGLFQYWIARYQQQYPEAAFRIENKGAAEYSMADLIVHGQELDKSELDKSRTYLTIARYAILPVANSRSPFAAIYGEKGLTREEIRQVFFFDPFSSESKKPLKAPYNVYTRVQQAPAPIVFARNFGYEQQDLHGRAIAGADIHLIQSIQKDTLGITYAPLPLIYETETGVIKNNLMVIPVDFDDNGRVQEDERFYASLPQLIDHLSSSSSRNIPVADITISISDKASPETIRFAAWILEKGLANLTQFGYLKTDEKTLDKARSALPNIHN